MTNYSITVSLSDQLRLALLLLLVFLLAPPAIGEETSNPEHWSFISPQHHAPPAVNDTSWGTNAIDPFILAPVEAAGLTPNPIAAPHHLIRRLSFDLTGLPPSPQEVTKFVSAFGTDPDKATAALVDRLLASQHFGERWARLWLDVARYAEDQAHIVGNKAELFYPNAYLYRDWGDRRVQSGSPLRRVHPPAAGRR